MSIIGQQNYIDLSVTEGGVYILSQESHEFGKEVEIFIQPENVQSVIDALEAAKQAVFEKEWDAGAYKPSMPGDLFDEKNT